MKKFFSYMLTAIVLALVGVFMVIKPDTFLGIVVIVFSLFLILDGIKSLYMLLRVKIHSLRFKWTMGIKALVNVSIGVISIIIAIKNPTMISNILVYLIAIDFFATAIIDLFDYIILRGDSLVTGTLGVEILISTLFGILFCLFPQFISHTAVTILAVVIICLGVMSGVIAFYALYVDRTFKKLGIDRNKLKSAEVEYTEVEDK